MDYPTRDIKDFEGLYAVDQDGRIWSYPRPKGFYTTKGYWLKGYRFKTGYIMYHLKKDQVDYNLLGHRAVAIAFIPNPMNLPCVNHKDCNPSNNNVENLEWCTHKQNSEYMKMQKRNHVGEAHHNAKLTDVAVIRIRSLYQNGKTSSLKLAKKFCVSKKTILSVLHRETWTHI